MAQHLLQPVCTNKSFHFCLTTALKQNCGVDWNETSERIEGSYQHWSVPLQPRRSYKNQSTIRLFETDPLCLFLWYSELCLLKVSGCISLHQVCISMSLLTLCTLGTWQQESVPNARLYDSLHHVCHKSAQVCKQCASSLHFYQPGVSPRKSPGWYADLVQNTCILCTLCADLMHTISEKVCIWRTMHTWPRVCKNLACTLRTLFLWCAKSAQCFKPSQTNLAKHLAIQHLCTRKEYWSSPGRAPAGSPPPLLSEGQRADLMHTCYTHNTHHIHTNYIDCTQNAYCVHTK